MKDTELYAQILGIGTPYFVSRVELKTVENRVSIYVEHGPKARFACPECDKPCSVYDHAEERTWRHLDTCQLRTLLHARVPRIKCSEHGVRQARASWADPNSRFTLLFERFAIDVMLETDGSGAAKILGLSWDEVQHLKERAVTRGRARKAHVLPKKLGMDEKAIAKGQTYLTLTCDLENGTVEHLEEGRTMESAAAYFSLFQPLQHRGACERRGYRDGQVAAILSARFRSDTGRSDEDRLRSIPRRDECHQGC